MQCDTQKPFCFPIDRINGVGSKHEQCLKTPKHHSIIYYTVVWGYIQQYQDTSESALP